MLASSQVYRNSVIAQWRALDLDVLLTPMLGPALDLNAPGKATGEVCCPSTHLGHSHLLLLFCEFSPVPAGCREVQEEPWRRTAPLGEGPALGELTVRLAGEMGVIWDVLGGNRLPVLSTTEVGGLELWSLQFGEVGFKVLVGFRKAKKNRNNGPGGEASWAEAQGKLQQALQPAGNLDSWALSPTQVWALGESLSLGWGQGAISQGRAEVRRVALAACGAFQGPSATRCSTTAWTSPRGWCLSPR